MEEYCNCLFISASLSISLASFQPFYQADKTPLPLLHWLRLGALSSPKLDGLAPA